MPTALIISLLGFMEAISIAKAMATRTKQKLDTNQELVGQGLANIVGSMALSYPVSGSFSRSAVALRAGARTGVGNVVSGLAVLVVLLFLSRWLYYLPQSVLAAIIILAVLRLLDFRSFVHAWRTNRVDGAGGCGNLRWSPWCSRRSLSGGSRSAWPCRWERTFTEPCGRRLWNWRPTPTVRYVMPAATSCAPAATSPWSASRGR